MTDITAGEESLADSWAEDLKLTGRDWSFVKTLETYGVSYDSFMSGMWKYFGGDYWRQYLGAIPPKLMYRESTNPNMLWTYDYPGVLKKVAKVTGSVDNSFLWMLMIMVNQFPLDEMEEIVAEYSPDDFLWFIKQSEGVVKYSALEIKALIDSNVDRDTLMGYSSGALSLSNLVAN